MAQSFLQGFQQTFGPAAQQGAVAAQEAAREREAARREQLKTVANLFVKALEYPGPQGERLFTGVLTILGVPPEQWDAQIQTLRSLDETKRRALMAMASGKDIEENLPHIVNFFGMEGVAAAEESRKRRAAQTLREEMALGTIPSAEPGGRLSSLFGPQAPGGTETDRFGDLLGFGHRALELGVIDPGTYMDFALNVEKARGDDPTRMIDAYERLLYGPQGGDAAPRVSPLGVPTLTIDSEGKARIGIDPTHRFKEDEPLPASQAARYRVPIKDQQGNIIGYKMLPPGATPRQAREMGAELLPDKQSQELEQMSGAAQEVLNQLDGLSQQIFTGDPGLMNRLREAAKWGMEYLTQENPIVSEYLDAKQSLSFLIVRMLGMVGNLSDRDLMRADVLFPNVFPLPDTKEVAERKMKRVRAIVKAATAGNGKLADQLFLKAVNAAEDEAKSRASAGEGAQTYGLNEAPRAQDLRSDGPRVSVASQVFVAPDGREITMAQVQRRAMKERVPPAQIIQKYGLQPK